MDFNEKARYYDSWYTTPFGSYADNLEKRSVFKFIGLNERKDILDVGCCAGIYSIELTRQDNVLGLDPSMEMLNFAMEKARRERLNIMFVAGTTENLSFKNQSFDIIVSITALCYFSDAKRAVEEMKRVIKPNGKIVIGIINKWSLYAVEKKLVSKFKDSVYKKARFYSILELKNLFGSIKWDSTLFALPRMPEWMLRIFFKIRKAIIQIFKPFGAFIFIEVKN